MPCPELCSPLLLAMLVGSPGGATSPQSDATAVGDPAPFGAVPSAQQLAWHAREFYAFVHFNMNTFTGVEWGHGTESPEKFLPTALDCNQWCALFRECGLSGVVLTAKHHDGFCLWPSAFTEHDVVSSPWQDGGGDVVRELAEACKQQGLWLGLYISPWDRNNPIYGRDDAAYNDYFDGQLRELLGHYGRVAEVWWDGANGDRNDPEKHQEYDWPRFVATVRELQPDAVIFAPPESGATVRWVGNERGYAGATQWSTYDRSLGEDTTRLNTGIEDASEWIPAETDVSIRPGWYWTADTDDRVKSVAALLDIHRHSVGHNTNLILNFPVDRRGLVHENDAAALRGLAAVLRATYARDLAREASVEASSVRSNDARFAGSCVVDADPSTYWATDDGVVQGALTLHFPAPTTFDQVTLQEPVQFGQRVRAFEIEARVGGEWQRVFEGTTIGFRRTAVFAAVTADAVRVRILDSRACPLLSSVQVQRGPATVSILPEARAFVESTSVTLSADQPDCEIRYTLDGSAPTAHSVLYEVPFLVDTTCTLQALAVTAGVAAPRTSSLELQAFPPSELREATHFFLAPQPGLAVACYEGGWQTLDQLEGRAPVRSTTCSGFDLAARSRDEHTALVFSGFVNVPRDGIYEFTTRSDDGSRLIVGDQRIVDNDGLHGMVERSGVVGLRAGYHPLRVEWFNATGAIGLEVLWSGLGIPLQEVPSSALFRERQ